MNKSITFLTRFYPPHPNVNGKEVRDMAYFLEKEFGFDIHVVTVNRNMDVGGVSKSTPVGTVHQLNSKFRKNNKWSRIAGMFYDGYIMAKKAKKIKDSYIIVTSSPPLLPFWASILFKKKVRWSFWSLDLFPEGLAATGYIKASHPFYKFLKKKTYQGNPNHIIALGPKQAKNVLQKYQKSIPYSIHPCGVKMELSSEPKNEKMPDWFKPGIIHFGYCGNLGDAHNADFIKEIANHINPEKHQLILSLYGNKAEEVKKYVQGIKGVIVMDYVSRLDLIDVHLVSLKSSWTHIAVPSKAMSAISMGCSVIFCGSKESDIWELFQNASWLVEESNDLKLQIVELIKNITLEKVEQKKINTPAIYQSLKNNVLTSYKEIAEMAQT